MGPESPSLFAMMPGQWTPALPLSRLDSAPVAFEIAGEQLVAFPSGDDDWTVLIDRCPHRGAALSLGRLLPDGTLQCRYHGWRFGRGGQCQRVPFNELSDAALAKITATAVPSRQAAGCLWIYTGTHTDSEPALPDSLQGPAHQFGTYHQEWEAHWTRAVENFIDFTHPPYAHRDTIGAYTHDFAESGGTAHVEIEDRDWGLVFMNFMGSRRYGFQLDWYAPNMTRLHFGPGHQLHVYSIPINARQTRVMTVRALPAGQDQAAWEARAASIDHQILNEDRTIVESQPGDVADAVDEISVASDAPTVRFRRWYRELLLAAGDQPKPITRSTVQ
jgi:phenylpropionate dioxygenase-like ring-hydroxylating dioxygenase large terminal subunit